MLPKRYFLPWKYFVYKIYIYSWQDCFVSLYPLWSCHLRWYSFQRRVIPSPWRRAVFGLLGSDELVHGSDIFRKCWPSWPCLIRGYFFLQCSICFIWFCILLFSFYLQRHDSKTTWIYLTRWWFQIFFMFTPVLGRFPFWLACVKWAKTTN